MSTDSLLRSLPREILQTVFRLAPWPTEPGLRRIGSPDRRSPVVLTGNYDLTVRRLARALEGLDVWLLVAPSGGINVWCAAAGGLLTTHQVVTALKTSGIADQVDHREVILPQLSATGVLALDVFRRSRWKVRFGPVQADQLPTYLETGEKTDAMRRVTFDVGDRLEMAALWGAPAAIVVGLLALLVRPGWAGPLTLLIAAMSTALFLFYDRLGPARRSVFAGASTLAALAMTAMAGGGLGALVGAAVAPILFTLLLTFDYPGSTPLEGGSHFEERRWRIAFDPGLCEGIFRCWEVCPEACFEKLEDVRKVALAHDDRCIRCGACVVQCPKDALFFEDESGERIEPDVIRTFKLNLMGQRTVASPKDQRAPRDSA